MVVAHSAMVLQPTMSKPCARKCVRGTCPPESAVQTTCRVMVNVWIWQGRQSGSGGSLVKQGNTHAPHKRVQHQVLPHHASASVHACCRAASQSPHISVHPQHRRDSVAYAGASCWYATSLRPLKPIHRAGQHRIVRSATPCLLELE